MVSLEIFFLCEHVNDNQPCVVFIPWLGNIAFKLDAQNNGPFRPRFEPSLSPITVLRSIAKFSHGTIIFKKKRWSILSKQVSIHHFPRRRGKIPWDLPRRTPGPVTRGAQEVQEPAGPVTWTPPREVCWVFLTPKKWI